MIESFFGCIRLQHPAKILSVNSLYKPASSVGKAFAWLYKDFKVELLQDKIVKEANKTDLSKIKNLTYNINYVDVDLIFLVDQNINKRDTTNMIKISEDALMQVTGIDDSKHRCVTAKKALSFIPKQEFIICNYTVHYSVE